MECAEEDLDDANISIHKNVWERWENSKPKTNGDARIGIASYKGVHSWQLFATDDLSIKTGTVEYSHLTLQMETIFKLLLILNM